MNVEPASDDKRPKHPLVGTVVEPYAILDVIAAGGMGVVFKARHTLTDRIVAMKLLPSELARDESNVQRVKLEAKALAQLKHPNIVTTFDFGFTAMQEPFIVMEYVAGESLKEVLDREVLLPVDRALRVFLQAVDGMRYAHSAKILHRDLKPHNIMVSNEPEPDHVTILDFGVAKFAEYTQKITRTGEVVGSPLYMSPEQCTGRPTDHRCDIYSIGVMMYETLTGNPPFRGENYISTVHLKCTKLAPNFKDVVPGRVFPDRLEMIVLKCLEIEPEKRYSTMAELKADLELVAGAIPKVERQKTNQSLPTTPGSSSPRTIGAPTRADEIGWQPSWSGAASTANNPAPRVSKDDWSDSIVTSVADDHSWQSPSSPNLSDDNWGNTDFSKDKSSQLGSSLSKAANDDSQWIPVAPQAVPSADTGPKPLTMTQDLASLSTALEAQSVLSDSLQIKTGGFKTAENSDEITGDKPIVDLESSKGPAPVPLKKDESGDSHFVLTWDQKTGPSWSATSAAPQKPRGPGQGMAGTRTRMPGVEGTIAPGGGDATALQQSQAPQLQAQMQQMQPQAVSDAQQAQVPGQGAVQQQGWQQPATPSNQTPGQNNWGTNSGTGFNPAEHGWVPAQTGAQQQVQGMTGTQQQSMPAQGMTGTHQQSMPPHGVTGTHQQGVPPQGMTGTHQQGVPPQGMPGTHQQGMPPNAMPPQGVTGTQPQAMTGTQQQAMTGTPPHPGFPQPRSQLVPQNTGQNMPQMQPPQVQQQMQTAATYPQPPQPPPLPPGRSTNQGMEPVTPRHPGMPPRPNQPPQGQRQPGQESPGMVSQQNPAIATPPSTAAPKTALPKPDPWDESLPPMNLGGAAEINESENGVKHLTPWGDKTPPVIGQISQPLFPPSPVAQLAASLMDDQSTKLSTDGDSDEKTVLSTFPVRQENVSPFISQQAPALQSPQQQFQAPPGDQNPAQWQERSPTGGHEPQPFGSNDPAPYQQSMTNAPTFAKNAPPTAWNTGQSQAPPPTTESPIKQFAERMRGDSPNSDTQGSPGAQSSPPGGSPASAQSAPPPAGAPGFSGTPQRQDGGDAPGFKNYEPVSLAELNAIKTPTTRAPKPTNDSGLSNSMHAGATTTGSAPQYNKPATTTTAPQYTKSSRSRGGDGDDSHGTTHGSSRSASSLRFNTSRGGTDGRKMVLMSLVGVAILAVIAISGFIVYQHSQSSNDGATVSQTPSGTPDGSAENQTNSRDSQPPTSSSSTSNSLPTQNQTSTSTAGGTTKPGPKPTKAPAKADSATTAKEQKKPPPQVAKVKKPKKPKAAVAKSPASDSDVPVVPRRRRAYSTYDSYYNDGN